MSCRGAERCERAIQPRVRLVLPVTAAHPVGGYRVQYEFANHLAACGMHVTISHLASMSRVRRVRFAAFVWKKLTFQPSRHLRWAALAPGVRTGLLLRAGRRVRQGRAVTIVTAWQTVAYADPAAGPVMQIVYDYEHWRTVTTAERADIAAALSRPGVLRIATSRVVADMLTAIGGDYIDVVAPPISIAAARPKPQSSVVPRVLVVLRGGPGKGADLALAALDLLARTHRDWDLVAFGDLLPAEVPATVAYLRQPNSNRLQDEMAAADVLVCTSEYEGFGLVPLEAMAQGTPVVMTASGGNADYAVHEGNCLLTSKREPSVIAAMVGRVLNDADLRDRIVEGGLSTVGAHALEVSLERLTDHVRKLQPAGSR